MSAGHIRPRGPGSWELKYDVGRDPLTGKRQIRYRTVRGTKRDAQCALREALAAVDKGQHVDPGKLTVGQWLGQWLEEARHSCSGKTWERFAEIVNKHLVSGLGALPLAKVQPVHVRPTTPMRSRAAAVRCSNRAGAKARPGSRQRPFTSSIAS